MRTERLAAAAAVTALALTPVAEYAPTFGAKKPTSEAGISLTSGTSIVQEGRIAYEDCTPNKPKTVYTCSMVPGSKFELVDSGAGVKGIRGTRNGVHLKPLEDQLPQNEPRQYQVGDVAITASYDPSEKPPFAVFQGKGSLK